MNDIIIETFARCSILLKFEDGDHLSPDISRTVFTLNITIISSAISFPQNKNGGAAAVNVSKYAAYLSSSSFDLLKSIFNS